ncbi:MAG TPA: periplasmic heavy metal sensor [Pyrinomonadaceae bacterium]
MKRTFTKRVAMSVAALFLLLLAISSSQEALAQTPGEPSPETVQDDQTQNWQGALGLTPDQIGRIRSILQEKKLERQAITQRLKQSQRALDEAIYSDNATEAVIEQRARDVAEAQAAQIHLRAMTELNIRRVLTPEQLDKFRTIRQGRMRAQAEQRLENGNQQRALKNDRLENSVQGNPRRPAADGQGGRNPMLTPRERRALFGRRVRP